MTASFITILKAATITLPAIEVSLLLILLTLCLVFKYTRIGLVASYLFTYRWGWMIVGDMAQTTMVAYLIFGMIVGILTVIGMMHQSSQNR